jgi:hypothetical protein
MEKALISRYNNDIKVWTAEVKKIKEDTMVVYSVVLGQMSEASRVECEQGIDLKKKENAKDLVYLINRIRATHIAVQSGNVLQDQERVRSKWYAMQMTPQDTSYLVEEYQMERLSVGLAVIPDSELVIGILSNLFNIPIMSSESGITASPTDSHSN